MPSQGRLPVHSVDIPDVGLFIHNWKGKVKPRSRSNPPCHSDREASPHVSPIAQHSPGDERSIPLGMSVFVGAKHLLRGE
jgi:hypothetical protein